MLKMLSVLGYLGMVGGILALLLRRSLFSPSPFVVVPQAGALALMIWARITFGRRSFHAAANPTEGGLVTTGPYRFVRHPIYTAVCLFVLTGVAANWSRASALLGALVVACALLRICLEERLLVVRYPEYAAYAQRTRRMIPFVW